MSYSTDVKRKVVALVLALVSLPIPTLWAVGEYRWHDDYAACMPGNFLDGGTDQACVEARRAAHWGLFKALGPTVDIHNDD